MKRSICRKSPGEGAAVAGQGGGSSRAEAPGAQLLFLEGAGTAAGLLRPKKPHMRLSTRVLQTQMRTCCKSSPSRGGDGKCAHRWGRSAGPTEPGKGTRTPSPQAGLPSAVLRWQLV